MRPISILIAEDEPIIAFDLRCQLECCEFQVLDTCEPASTEYMCTCLHPDMVILNFRRMDKVDGLALALALKLKFMLPVLIITGASKQEITASRNFESTLEILYKPFTHAQLLHSVQKCCALLEPPP